MHQNPTNRENWAPQGKYGWYIDQSKDHYLCYEIYVPKTRAVIQPDTVEFSPHNSKMPFRSLTENATIAATELIHALRNPTPEAPYAHIGDVQVQALEQLDENFQRVNIKSQQQVPTTARQQQIISPPRLAPSFPRVITPPITVTPTAPPIMVAPPVRLRITPPIPSQSDTRLHIISPDTPTSPRVQQRNIIINRQQKATNVPPLKQTTPNVIPPNIHIYPFRHRRHQKPALIIARYANATNHIYNLEANAVLNPLTGVLQEFRHLIQGPDKEIWTKSLANEFGRLTQGVQNRIEGTNTMYFIPKEEVSFETKKVTYPKISYSYQS